jgi:hypothetical protein
MASPLYKAIDANLKAIGYWEYNEDIGDKLAEQTAKLVIRRGNETSEYGLAASLVNLLSFNPILQKQIIFFFEGKIPHSWYFFSGKYHLSKKQDHSLLQLQEDKLAKLVIGQSTEPQRTKVLVKYKPSREEVDEPERCYFAFSEFDRRLDASKDYYDMYRDNGRFGSYPSHDGFDDESEA